MAVLYICKLFVEKTRTLGGVAHSQTSRSQQQNKRLHAETNAKKQYSAAGRSCASGRVGGRTRDARQSRKLRQLQAEMIALANDREKATSADECRAIDAKLRALAERGAAMKHVKMSPEEKPCAACKRPTARTVVSEGRAHRFCSVECASSRVRIKACRLDGVEVDVPSLRRRRVRDTVALC